MSAKEKLKLLMGFKARRIWLLGAKSWYLYYTPQDAKEIDSWDEDNAEDVWEDICTAVEGDFSCEMGLSSATCPWCVFWEMACKKCGYAKRHGRCGNLRSDWFRIITELGGDPLNGKLCQGLFPASWYRQVIRQIEER